LLKNSSLGVAIAREGPAWAPPQGKECKLSLSRESLELWNATHPLTPPDSQLVGHPTKADGYEKFDALLGELPRILAFQAVG
jgi:hypothetical protein